MKRAGAKRVAGPHHVASGGGGKGFMAPIGLAFERFTVTDLDLECGAVLPTATIAYHLRGWGPHARPILTCSAFAQSYGDLSYLVDEEGALAGWPVIHTELLANGRSTSPSNTDAPYAGPSFPAVSVRDNVAMQQRLLDHLGVDRVAAVVGASMGAQQALQWAVTAPDRVGAVVAIAGNGRASWQQRLFLNALREALVSDPAFSDGRYAAPPLDGLARLSAAWAPWALSPMFFEAGEHQAYQDTQAQDIDGFLAKWRTRYFDRDANDLLSHLATWAAHDIGDRPSCEASFASAAARATAPILFLPIRTDAYFPPDLVAAEAGLFPNATVTVIESVSGHAAAFGRSPDDRAAITAAMTDFLRSVTG